MLHKSFAAIIATILSLSMLTAGLVSAHAELDRSNPESGSTVEGAPNQVEIWFTEEIAEGSAIEVADASGTSVTAAAAKLDLFDPDRKHLTVELRPNLPNGLYTVTWTSISAEDGDTETDSFTFTIAGSGTPVASPVASPHASPATTVTPPATKVSGSLQSTDPPKAQKANIDERALLIALSVGAAAGVMIYLFWRLVRPKRHPFDRNPR